MADFTTKATVTGVLGALSLALALFSPVREVTTAEALVDFASGENVRIERQQTNKGLIGFMLAATVGAAAWTVTGNGDPEIIVDHTAPAGSTPATNADSRQPQKTAEVPQRQQPESIEANTLDEFWQQGVNIADIAAQFDFETRKVLLWDALEAHEEGWILRLLNWPVLLVIGRPGSAKSSFSAALAITRELFISGLRQTIVSDPNAHLKVRANIWQSVWEINGARDNWGDIGGCISQMYKRFADSDTNNLVSSVYDEVTTYNTHVNPNHLGGFLSQVTSKARACKEFITIVSHNDTLKCLGGETGEGQLKDDMAQLSLGSRATKIGETVPTGKGVVDGLDVNERNKPIAYTITLPRWFDPDLLSKLFPELYRGDEQSKTDSEDEEPKGKFSIDPQNSQEVDNASGKWSGSVGKSSDRKSVSDDMARAAQIEAAKNVQGQVYLDYEIDIPLPNLLEAFKGVMSGKSNTSIIEDDLKLGGRNFEIGKAALEIIKQTITIRED